MDNTLWQLSLSASEFRSKSFVSTYGLDFRQNNTIDRGLKYVGINAGNMDVTVVYSTDGLNKRFGLVTLEDDLHFFPEYNGVYLLRADLYEDFPKLEEHIYALNFYPKSWRGYEMRRYLPRLYN